MKKFVIAVGVIISLGAIGYLGNVILKAVGSSLGDNIIEAIPDKHQFFTSQQETFLKQVSGTWVEESDTTHSAPMTISLTKEDLTITQVDRNNLVYPAKHVKVDDPRVVIYNLGQKPNMTIELVDADTLSVPDLNATNDTEPTAPVKWVRIK